LLKSSLERYQKVKSDHLTSDNYVSRAMQTFNHVKKNKDVQAIKFRAKNSETQYLSSHQKENEEEIVFTGTGVKISDVLVHSVNVYEKQSFSRSSFSDSDSNSSQKKMESIAKLNLNENSTTSESLPASLLPVLLLMESVVISSFHSKKIMEFFLPGTSNEKNAKDSSKTLSTMPEFSKSGHGNNSANGNKTYSFQNQYQGTCLMQLFTLKSELSKGRKVVSMSWNYKNTILAVIYSSVQQMISAGTNASSSYILLWSLRNIEVSLLKNINRSIQIKL
jgi:hypothetical protein